MKKDKKTQFKPEGKIKHMLRTNYWLTPLLLVALVFAIVFGVSKIPDLSTTVKGWFTKEEKCKACEAVTFQEFNDKITANEDGKVFYVVFTQSNCSGCKELFPVLNKFLKTNQYDKDGNLAIDIISIDVTMKNETEFKDSTLTLDKLNKFKSEFTEKLTKGELQSPAIIKYEGKEMKDALVGGGQSYNGLMEFFGIDA